MKYDITIVIPVKDDLRVINCIRSIDDDRADILVVMNDSSDSVKHIVKNSGVNYIEVEEAGGPNACEIGIENSSTRYVLMVDSDCIFLPGTISHFINHIGSADFIRGTVLYRHENYIQRVVARSRYRHTNNSNMLFKVPLMINKNVRENIGGYIFDKRLSWTEDYDLTIRAKECSVKIIRLKEAIVIHDSLSPICDLKSIFFYGFGHADGVFLKLNGYHPVKFTKILSGISDAIRIYGVCETLYGALSNIIFYVGYKYNEFWRKNEKKF